jgi:hypothetical protein
MINVSDNDGEEGSINTEARDLEQAMHQAEMSNMPESTKKQMEDHGNKFICFLRSRQVEPSGIKDICDSELNTYLRHYYYQLTTKMNELYSPSSLVCIRAAIQRYLNIVCGRSTNLVAHHSPFDSSNRMLICKIREYIQLGKSVEHYDAIEDGDMVKLKDYFNRDCAEKLQDELIFHLLYEFGERGQEHLKHFLQKGALIRNVDSDGREYVTLPSLPSKNRTASFVEVRKADDEKYARIYNLELINLYEQLIPDGTSFMPKPLSSTRLEKYRFSSKAHRGLRYLQNFMRNLSSKAKLSRMYSNHCVR